MIYIHHRIHQGHVLPEPRGEGGSRTTRAGTSQRSEEKGQRSAVHQKLPLADGILLGELLIL